MSVDWNAVGAVGQWAGAAGTFAAVLYVLYGDLLKRPKLMLGFDGSEDVANQRNTPGDPPTAVSRWARIRIENKPGRRLAKRCTAFLTRITDITDEKKPIEVFPHADMRRLLWTHIPGSQTSVDLLPGVVYRADLVAGGEGRSALSVRTDPLYGIDRPGKYLLRVVVSAEGANPVAGEIVIEWNGQWVSLTGRRR